MKVSDCCGCSWSAIDGWPNCDRCDRVCVLEDSIARSMRMAPKPSTEKTA